MKISNILIYNHQILQALIDLSPTFLWSLFSQVQSTFPFRYAVYHHLRSKGWVVKSGCKFGGDFGECPIFFLMYLKYFFVFFFCSDLQA
jgi:tRNA intron endonuclease, catalytic C-terminal domain